uniref:NADH-ubiquinone oxidoreductase chain 6 n=1 Tax=Upogebia bowerbankii TaxID=2302679 RepID=A0A411ATW7_9EUCA|nr:NADH dehydrogenase subunit 6 [Upogebia bowerbankii]QAX91448.1 NADH dehydrogenase subunit 6 [Upogebia bowerbankii]
MLFITLPLTLFLAALFTQLTHPLSLGLTLLLQTILICTCTNIMLPSFWFSYILFLIFLGAMLVLFIYVTSLASNEPFMLSLPYFLFFLLFITSLSIMFIFSDLLITYMNQSNPTNFYLYNSMNHTSLLTSVIYNQSTMIFTIFIVLYLLLTLFVVVKITNVFFGPLRVS